MSIFLFNMPEEIEGRELSARFRQGQLYIPKFYRDMFDIKEGDYFVLEVVKHSHAKIKYKPIQNNSIPKKEKKSFSNSQPPLTVPNLMDDSDFPSPSKRFLNGNYDEETPWKEEE